MSQDEIIAMAREVIGDYSAQHYWPFFTEELFRFAALVAAKEREACAKLIEGMTERRRWVRGGINGTPTKPCEYAASLRARSIP